LSIIQHYIWHQFFVRSCHVSQSVWLASSLFLLSEHPKCLHSSCRQKGCTEAVLPKIPITIDTLFVNWHSPATLTEIFPCFFLSCKANAKVELAKTGTICTLLN